MILKCTSYFVKIENNCRLYAQNITVYIVIKSDIFSKSCIHVSSSNTMISIIKRYSSLIHGNMTLLIITFATSCIFKASLALAQSI